MQRLMILRHAKAVPWYPRVDDFPRALDASGRDHAARVAGWISDTLQLPDGIFCSPAQRTRETLAPLLALRPELEARANFVPQLYGATSRTLTALLDTAFVSYERVLVVGHNPGMENLAFDIIGPGDRSRFRRLPTGTLLVVEFPSGWPDDAGRGRLVHVVRGKSL